MISDNQNNTHGKTTTQLEQIHAVNETDNRKSHKNAKLSGFSKTFSHTNMLFLTLLQLMRK